MDRYITITDTVTGDRATCDVYDIETTLTAWHPEAREVAQEIDAFAAHIRGERYPQADAGAALGVRWEWALPLNLHEAAEHLGVSYATIRRYRSQDRTFPAPDVTLGQSPGWHTATLDQWKAQRPGQGVGGGRPALNHGEEV